MKFMIFSIFMALVVMLSGCSRDVEILTRFSQPQALQSGDPVQYNGETIGRIDKVDQPDQIQTVYLHINPDKLAGLSTTSVAMAVSEPQRIEIYSNNKGDALQAGGEIRGLNNAIELASWTAQGAVGSLKGMLGSAAGSLNELMNNPNWDKLTSQLNQAMTELGEQSAGAVNQLGRELKEFMEQMQNQSSETLKRSEDLSKQLNEQLKNFQSQGKDEIARILEEMLNAFNATLDPDALSPDNRQQGEPL